MTTIPASTLVPVYWREQISCYEGEWWDVDVHLWECRPCNEAQFPACLYVGHPPYRGVGTNEDTHEAMLAAAREHARTAHPTWQDME